MKIKSQTVALILIVLAGFALRVWGINFGPYHPDEPLVINQALAFGSGNPMPWVYYYPPLFHYILFIFYGLFFIAGWLLGPFRIFENFLNLVLINPTPFYVIGRFLVAIMGSATIFIVYAITKRFYSKAAAFLSSIFMSFMYLHVRNSHYCTVDVPMTFVLVVAYYFILRIVDTNDIKDYLLAGLFAGLAIATKYNAGILIPCIGFAAITNISFKNGIYRNIRVIKNLALGYICAVLIFLVICSYVIFDFAGFAQALNVLSTNSKNMNIDLWYRFRVDLFYGMGLLLELLGLLGFIYIFIRKKKKGLVFVSFFFLYLFGMRRFGQPFARYTIPVLPFFAISAGIFLDAILHGLKIHKGYKRIIACCVIVIAFFMTGIKSIYSDYLLSKPDIRALAREWIYNNIPDGVGIAIDNPQYAPFLYPTKEQLEDKLALITNDTKGGHIKRKRIELLIKSKQYAQHEYRVYYLTNLGASVGFIMHTPTIPFDKKVLDDNNIDYIITNDISQSLNGQFYNSIKSSLLLLKRLSPLKNEQLGYSPYSYSYLPIDNTLFNLRNNGVGLRIYKVIR